MVKLNLLERFLNKIHAKVEETSSLSTFTMDLPNPLAGGVVQSSDISDKPSDLPPLIDDTLNNDFFYDDEFTVPFDANLTEDCRSLPPEVDSLLRRLLPVDGNLEWRRAKMALSKSDSCLYQADLEEPSDSEREMSTSSNNSPLENQSLFSSCGDQPVDEVTTLHEVEVADSLMSGSLAKDVDRYSYDWSTGKQQYVLLFDRSPTKTGSSEEESGHQMSPKVTTWSRSKPGKAKRKTEEPGRSTGSPVRKPERERERKASPGLTSWGQVKNQRTSPDGAGGGFTTWQQVKQTHATSFKTLPVGKMDEKRMETVVEELLSPTGGAVDLAPDVTSRGEEAASRKLLNIYCKMRSQDEMNEFENNEAMASPPSLEKLLESWSESLGLGRAVDVVYHADLIPSPPGAAPSDVANPVPRKDQFSGCRVEAFPRPPLGVAAGEQAGSPVLTSSLLRGHDTVDCSMQFPPASRDCAVQTSFQFSTSESSLTESKAQQTSVIASVAFPSPGSAGFSSVMENKMVLSAHLLTRPLPDLSFLKKGGVQSPGMRVEEKEDASARTVSAKGSDKALEKHHVGMSKNETGVSRNEVGTSRNEVGTSRNEVGTGRNEDGGQDFSKPAFPGRLQDNRASSSSDSRDSSPRPVVYRNRSRSSDSTSTYSVCSTSSSGIDPGFCDSSGSGTRTPRLSRIFDTDSARGTPEELTEAPKVPIKPPRLFAIPDEVQTWKNPATTALPQNRTSGSGKNCEIVGICDVCNSQIFHRDGKDDDDDAAAAGRSLAASHPIFFRDRPSKWKRIDYLLVSPTHSRSPGPLGNCPKPHRDTRASHGTLRLARGRDHVTLRGNQQQGTKPAKSILVRRRQINQAKHRSWSNPSCEIDDLGPRYGYLPRYLVGDRRPVSLPDENLLLQNHSGTMDEHGECLFQLRKSAEEEETRDGIGRKASQIVEEVDPVMENRGKDEECDYERFKAKKSVSFSEKIFYHSTSATTSPLDSPKCPQVAPVDVSHREAPSAATAVTKKVIECKPPSAVDGSNFRPEVEDAELPPSDFMVSPNLSPSSSLSGSEVSLSTDILHKRELVFDVMRAVEVLVRYFSQTRDSARKVQLGSTVESGEVGRLVLEHLCPAIHAIVLDGLKPHVNSLFGKVKNSACKVMEDSAELGQPIELIQGLVKSLKILKFLNTPWLLFNAFIFGLLNYKALDFWLTYIHSHKTLLSRHYSTSSFIRLSSSSTHRLFLDMVTSLQPLAQLPFRLEYNFETRMLDRRQQEQLAEYLLDRHVSRSVEAYIEGQQYLTQLENLSMSQRDEQLMRFAESRLSYRTKELWRKTQRHLVEKLSHSGERLATESTALVKSFARAAMTRRPRPMSLPGAFRSDDFRFGNSQNFRFGNSPACVRNLANGESEELMGSGDGGRLVESSGSGSDGEGGFLGRLTKHLKDMNLRERVYRKGATDYSFDESNGGKNFPPEEKPDGKLEEAPVRKAEPVVTMRRTVSGMISGASSPQNLIKSSTSRTEAIPSQTDAHNTQPTATTHRSSSSRVTTSSDSNTPVNSTTSQTSHSSMPSSLTGKTEASGSVGSIGRKRWSDIGCHLVNIFDRLLLSDTKTTSSMSLRPSSSSVVKCPSMGQLDSSWLTDGQGIRGKKWTSNEFVRTNSLESTKNHTDTGHHDRTARNLRCARTLCHYVATDSHQLSFEKGTSIVVLQDCNTEWKLCRHGQHVGLIHNACISAEDTVEGRGSC